jgi:hypothetical protein
MNKTTLFEQVMQRLGSSKIDPVATWRLTHFETVRSLIV